ncbi:MAG: hypothetical protein M1820_005255 [Bogoriella megaspora]|nr:MAG: hypothetical protein M1820_005255 [Bogoriella megaspora]
MEDRRSMPEPQWFSGVGDGDTVLARSRPLHVTPVCAAAGYCTKPTGTPPPLDSPFVKYDLHILPSGIVHPTAVNLIGSGTVVSVAQFFKELSTLKEKGINTTGRIFVSDRAHLLFELHRSIDGLEEKALGGAKIGTTGNGERSIKKETFQDRSDLPQGIGPCYSDKAARSGVRIAEMMDKAYFDERLRRLAKSKKGRFGDLLQYDVEAEILMFDKYRKTLQPFVVDGVEMVCRAQDDGTDILIEGANALMLDIDYGTYPFVTSSDTGLAGVFTGLGGLRPETLTTRIGVVKAYTTRVGSGPFPTECFDEAGSQLQERGAEFGTTTGRRRRCGWLDMVILRHSHRINRYTHINLTKLDVLDNFETLKIAVAYRSRNEDGSVVEYRDRFPADLSVLENDRLEVQYQTVEGWRTDITSCRTFADLPEQARKYVKFVENDLGVPVRWIGVGPGREAMIEES